MCALPNNETQELAVLPGDGKADATLTFQSGLANVTALRGDYLNSVMGVGGSGAVLVRMPPALGRSSGAARLLLAALRVSGRLLALVPCACCAS